MGAAQRKGRLISAGRHPQHRMEMRRRGLRWSNSAAIYESSELRFRLRQFSVLRLSLSWYCPLDERRQQLGKAFNGVFQNFRVEFLEVVRLMDWPVDFALAL